MYASARAETGLPPAVPRRAQASSGSESTSCVVDARMAAYSRMRLALVRRVAHVQHDLLERPLPRPVGLLRLRLGDAREEGDRLVELRAEMVAHVAGGDEGDVARVPVGVLVLTGSHERGGGGGGERKPLEPPPG